LTTNPEENFSVSIFDLLYNFRQLWNTKGFWTLDIKDADGNILVLGVKLVTQLNLLNLYPQVPFDLYSSNDNDPTRNDLNSFLLQIIEK
jgi:hypothetical protein